MDYAILRRILNSILLKNEIQSCSFNASCIIHSLRICSHMERHSSHDQYFSSFSYQKVYAIARKDFTPETNQKIQKYLSYMKENDINYPQFYELACWPDDVRRTGLRAFDGWHYSDEPFYDGIDPEDATFIPHPHYNVTHTVSEIMTILKKGDNGQMFYKSWMLRYFLHLMGDMHQPMHMTTRVSQEHKDGDKGGNLFILKGGAKNLHALWDTVMHKIPKVKRVWFG
eukprot:TRINITY_DN105038_c0_g1_i1.p1 TRINITY_DN105038_c0_g1~~TRINITY_DN105038_c0_g1_i1.p1  ORF type:complete len:259 (-),score=27.42 TRINITY_DN105038_c0_g1_i1:371-1051(-)